MKPHLRGQPRGRRDAAPGHSLLCGLAVAMLLVPGAVVVAPRAEAAFPGRNGRIAFTVNQIRDPSGQSLTGADFDLFTVSPSGHGLRRLTEGPDTDDSGPAWSPDGRQIVFSRFDWVGYSKDIYVTDGRGGDVRNLTTSPLVFEGRSSWSPDGRRIVFDGADLASDPTGSEIYIMASDGSETAHVTSGMEPAWSPTEDLIAYVDNGFVTPRGGAIRLVRPDGSDAGIIGAAGRKPSWSPDGTRIAFESGNDIWVVNRDGSHLANLTGLHAPGDDASPAWSPDGRWIAFVSERGDDYNLFKMRSDGSDITRIIDVTLSAGPISLDWGRRT